MQFEVSFRKITDGGVTLKEDLISLFKLFQDLSELIEFFDVQD
jgi:hypothetical protein